MLLQSRQEDSNDQLTQEYCDNERESSSGKTAFRRRYRIISLDMFVISPPDRDDRLFIHTFGAIDAFYRL
jgi:hypothetical protein